MLQEHTTNSTEGGVSIKISCSDPGRQRLSLVHQHSVPSHLSGKRHYKHRASTTTPTKEKPPSDMSFIMPVATNTKRASISPSMIYSESRHLISAGGGSRYQRSLSRQQRTVSRNSAFHSMSMHSLSTISEGLITHTNALSPTMTVSSATNFYSPTIESTSFRPKCDTKHEVHSTSHNLLNETTQQQLSRVNELLGRLWSNVKNASTLYTYQDGSRMVLNVQLQDGCQRKSFTGTLYLTLPTIFFMDTDGSKEVWIGTSMIRQVERGPLTTAGAILTVRCKDYRCFNFVIPTDRDRQEVFDTLANLQRTRNSLENLPCFTFQPSPHVRRDIGWQFLDLREEYERMGVPNDRWFYTPINRNYEICDTYPSHLFVPTTNSKILTGSSQFRSRGRLPVLSYLHTNGKSALCRSSQPLAGLRAQCREDQDLLAAILSANPDSQMLYVVDTRPMVNAITNRVQGKGWENDKYYRNIVCQFFPIHNIHVMRTSGERLAKVCEDTECSLRTYLSEVDASSWLNHIQAIFDTALFIVQTMNSGSSVLVHCSDGWDRTAQTCALAQIILEPRYRTIEGFLTLIDKEWLSFGHKFTERCGQLSSGDPQEVAPIFTQFLDCVWQLVNRMPHEFQFNERLLLALHDAAQSGLYGNFVGNCVKDRVDLRVMERSFSFWACHCGHVNDYTNSLYAPQCAANLTLHPISPQMFQVWHGMYSRGCVKSPHWNEMAPQDHLSQLNTHNSLLRAHQTWLTQQIQTLCQRLQHSLPETLQQMSLSQTSYSLFEDSLATVASSDTAEDEEVKNPEGAKFLRLDSGSEVVIQEAGEVAVESPLAPPEFESVEENPLTTSGFIVQGEEVLDHPLAGTNANGIDWKVNHVATEVVIPNLVSPVAVDEESADLAVDPLTGLASTNVLLEGDTLKNVLQLITKEGLTTALKTVAVEWSGHKTTSSCHECRKLFDSNKRKIHCCMCGHIHCRLCTRVVKRLLGVSILSTDNTNTDNNNSTANKLPSAEISLCLKCYKEHQTFCESLIPQQRPST